MGSLHGLPEKVSQIIGFRNLSENADSNKVIFERHFEKRLEEILPVIEHHLGLPSTSVFLEISPTGIAASIGQVHRAKLLSGEDVAVKIQYPEASDRLNYEVSLLSSIANPLTTFFSTADTRLLQTEVKESLLRELDYTREAEALSRFYNLAQDLPWLIIPKVYKKYSTEKMLIMEWIDGQSVESALSWPLHKQQKLCQRLLDLFLIQWFRWGEIHSDPHPGNLKVRWNEKIEDVEIVLYDFGVTHKLTPSFQVGIRRLIEPRKDVTEDAALNEFCAVDFNPALLRPMKNKLPAIKDILTKPFVQNELMTVGSWRLRETLEEILGEDRWNFRAAGPAHIIYFLRSFSGLLNYLKLFNLPLSWSNSLSIVQPSQVLSDSSTSSSSSSLDIHTDRELFILILENGEQVVKLRMNAEVLSRLDEVMPEGLISKLEEQGVSVTNVAATAIRNGFPAGELFHTQYPSSSGLNRDIQVAIV